MKRAAFPFAGKFLWVPLLSGLCWAQIAHAEPDSLCSPQEHVLFTCSIGKKRVSVCASKELTQTAGYVQYRFGRPEHSPELVYPPNKIHPAGQFSYGEQGAAHSSLENLLFTRGGYSYTLYREASSLEATEAGVRLKMPDGSSVRLKCRGALAPSDLYELNDLGLRKLPPESLLSAEFDGDWPGDSPNVDLLVGVRNHDFALVEAALKNGADVNYRGKYGFSALGAVADQRWSFAQGNGLEQFDDESDRLIALLLAHGAVPAKSGDNGSTAIIPLAMNGAARSVHTLLDAGWPHDYQYRLFVGALLGDPALVKDSLNHGGDPNRPVQKGRILDTVLGTASRHSSKGSEAKQKQDLEVLELLLKAGARIDPGTLEQGGGDIVRVYAYSGQEENIKPVLDMLIRYAPADARRNALHWLSVGAAYTHPRRKENLAWLLKRLANGENGQESVR